MLANAKLTKMLMVAAVAALAFQPAGAQNDKAKAAPGATAKVAAAAEPTASDTLDRAKILRTMADALGMVRWSDVGAGKIRLPGVDVVNRMEIWGSGTGL